MFFVDTYFITYGEKTNIKCTAKVNKHVKKKWYSVNRKYFYVVLKQMKRLFAISYTFFSTQPYKPSLLFYTFERNEANNVD